MILVYHTWILINSMVLHLTIHKATVLIIALKPFSLFLTIAVLYSSKSEPHTHHTNYCLPFPKTLHFDPVFLLHQKCHLTHLVSSDGCIFITPSQIIWVLDTELRAQHVLSKCSPPGLQPQPIKFCIVPFLQTIRHTFFIYLYKCKYKVNSMSRCMG